MTDTAPRLIEISVPVLLNAEVEYYSTKDVTLHLTNLTAEPILVESISLQFQPDAGSAPMYVDHPGGLRLPGNEVGVITIPVTPRASYFESTNMFDVMVHLRQENGGALGPRIPHKQRGSYLILRSPQTILCDVFVSFKQNEDLKLAQRLEKYARRAGLRPYLVIGDPQPGTPQWIRIEEAIKRAKAAFIIWGNRTEWGEGVKREIGLCRTHNIPEVLLLEEGIELPSLFDGINEFSLFHREDPAEAFATAVESVRRRPA